MHSEALKSKFAAAVLTALLIGGLAPEPVHARAAPSGSPAPNSAASAVTYLPPNISSVSPADLKHYYKWQHKMDWLLAPIHTRADLKKYLKAHAKSGSPLDALSPDARKRLFSELHFGRYGAFLAWYGDLQYLSTEQVYKILALFGEQRLASEFTGDQIRAASPRAAPQSGKPSRVERRFAKYLQAVNPAPGDTQAKRSNRAKRNYARWFAPLQNPHSLRTLGSHDLRLLFRATSSVALATFDAKYARDAYMDFSEMEKRHFAGPPDYEQMYETLVHSRQFAAAHKFYEDHSDADLAPFPAYRDEAKDIGKHTPTLLVVSATKHELIRRPVNLDKPAQVVILTDPHCEFCADFEATLQSQPKLRKALEQHSVWITPPGSVLEFDALQQWNKAHPRLRLNIMYSLQGWPMVKIIATPQFFFLRHGKLVAHEDGWGKDSLTKIKSGLKAIGL
jgi:hypothetical protein